MAVRDRTASQTSELVERAQDLLEKHVDYLPGAYSQVYVEEAVAAIVEALSASTQVDAMRDALIDARNNILSLLGGFRDDMPDAAVKLFQAQARQIDAVLSAQAKTTSPSSLSSSHVSQ